MHDDGGALDFVCTLPKPTAVPQKARHCQPSLSFAQIVLRGIRAATANLSTLPANDVRQSASNGTLPGNAWGCRDCTCDTYMYDTWPRHGGEAPSHRSNGAQDGWLLHNCRTQPGHGGQGGGAGGRCGGGGVSSSHSVDQDVSIQSPRAWPHPRVASKIVEQVARMEVLRRRVTLLPQTCTTVFRWT